MSSIPQPSNAARADHRALGEKLDLFHLQPEAPGGVFWHPRGWALFRRIEEQLRRLLRAHGYQEVRSPQVLAASVWEQSGHWQNFQAGMLLVPPDCALKPVSCPGHILLFQHARPSHRDLPLRYAEFGLCHRNEPSGALQGLFRLRQFTQDDGHLFCAEEHVVAEVARFCRSLACFYAAFGFEAPQVAFSSRPAVRAGSDALWDRAEAWLLEAAHAAGLEPALQPGEGAFYGPKLEFALRDAAGRSWQCGTIQLDLVLPERFGLSYAARDGAPRPPVMLHRAVVGSLERFVAILLEHHQGALPAWLHEEHVRVLRAPGGSGAEALVAELRGAGVRAVLDASEAPLREKVAAAWEACVPWSIAFGAREDAGGPLQLRPQSGVARVLQRSALVRELAQLCAEPTLD